MIERLQLEKFTAFEKLDLKFSPGINIIIGQNGTGKTHILKTLYSSLVYQEKNVDFVNQIINVFLPKDKQISRLFKRSTDGSWATITITMNSHPLTFQFSSPKRLGIYKKPTEWPSIKNGRTVFITAKEFLTHAPGFNSLYMQREIHFDETYFDLLTKAFLPPLKQMPSQEYDTVLKELENCIGGTIVVRGQTFFVKDSHGELEFDLLAEGTSKMGLLWLLINNGTLENNSTLFWDEPESNMNPSMISTLVNILYKLQSVSNIQMFITTHNYVLLKEFDLQKPSPESIRFISLLRDKKTNEISAVSGNSYLDVVPNEISDAFTNIYDKEIQKLAGVAK